MAADADANLNPALLTALATEHSVLQAAASATYADAAARSSLYVLALSSSLVAIGFMSQSPDVFPVFVAIVLPAVFVLGVLTVIRLIDSSLENQQAEAGIARIRAYYRTLGPDAEKLFAASSGRWPEGPAPAMGLGSLVAFLGTTATMIAFINSVVAGVGVAMLVDGLVGGADVVVQVLAGLVAVVVLMAVFLAFQRWRYATDPTTRGIED